MNTNNTKPEGKEIIIKAEELWDKYSEHIDYNVYSFESVAGTSVIKRSDFIKAVCELSPSSTAPQCNGKSFNEAVVKFREENPDMVEEMKSWTSTAPQPLDSIVDEYYDVYCPSKGITGIYTDNFIEFIKSQGFKIVKEKI